MVTNSSTNVQNVNLSLTIDFENFDIYELPWCFWHEKSTKIPKRLPGIYFLIDIYDNKPVQYIGMSVNIRNRLMSHTKRINFNAIPELQCVWLEFVNLNEIEQLERFFIKSFLPKLNKRFVS